MTFLSHRGRLTLPIIVLYVLLGLAWFVLAVLYAYVAGGFREMSFIMSIFSALILASSSDFYTKPAANRLTLALAPLFCGTLAAGAALAPLDFGLPLNLAGYLLLAFAALHGLLAVLLFRAFAPAASAP